MQLLVLDHYVSQRGLSDILGLSFLALAWRRRWFTVRVLYIMGIEFLSLGYVRNTEPLDARRIDFYSFQVQAEDCGGRVSEDATVNVQVNPICRRGLTGL